MTAPPLPSGMMDPSFHCWWFLGMRVETFSSSIPSSTPMMGVRNSCVMGVGSGDPLMAVGMFSQDPRKQKPM